MKYSIFNENNEMKYMDKICEQLEAQKIISEVFFSYIPDKDKIKVMAQAAERIKNEVRDPNEGRTKHSDN